MEPHHAEPPERRFGAGLTEAEVRRLQMILHEESGAELALPEAWSRASELLSLVEMLLQSNSDDVVPSQLSTAVRASSLLTDSPS